MKVILYQQWPTFIHNSITPAADVSRLSLLHSYSDSTDNCQTYDYVQSAMQSVSLLKNNRVSKLLKSVQVFQSRGRRRQPQWWKQFQYCWGFCMKENRKEFMGCCCLLIFFITMVASTLNLKHWHFNCCCAYVCHCDWYGPWVLTWKEISTVFVVFTIVFISH